MVRKRSQVRSLSGALLISDNFEGGLSTLLFLSEYPSQKEDERIEKCAPVRFGWGTHHLDRKGCVWLTQRVSLRWTIIVEPKMADGRSCPFIIAQ